VADEFYLGEGLVGQCALEKQKIHLSNVPGDYIRISSGLGHSVPVNIIVLPILFEGQVKAVLELASFDPFNAAGHALLDQLTESIGIVINTIEANMRTEDLLTQSRTDLLLLINDILNLSKIESRTVAVDIGELRLSDLHNYVERTFRHVAESKGLEFTVNLDPVAPRAMLTDAKRLQQVIKNLLSNAFKFTREGRVSLTIRQAESGARRLSHSLRTADSVLAFAVHDTGIGSRGHKQLIISEAFQHADGS